MAKGNFSLARGIADFDTNIIIDEEAFMKAASQFDELSGKIDSLRADIDDMLNQLKTGFDTPAGKKFIASCENSLIPPLEEQKIVVTHIAENLRYAKQTYQTIFDDYRKIVQEMSVE